MHVGVTIHATDEVMDPVELAREAETRGFHSLYIPEHTHIPTSRETPAPTGTPELAREYLRTLDPYIALAAASSVTDRILLGTGIGLVAQHDPITFAKEIATLDRLCGGRFAFGIGYGWNREEMRNHGVAFHERRAIVRERMLAMQALWSQERASFAGEHVRFEESWSWPKPVQRPRPPVLIGGAPGPKLFRHIAEDADGWDTGRIEAEFGTEVASIVTQLTEDKSQSWEERKQAAIDGVPHLCGRALAVKAADKLHNLESLVFDLDHAADPEDVWVIREAHRRYERARKGHKTRYRRRVQGP